MTTYSILYAQAVKDRRRARIRAQLERGAAMLFFQNYVLTGRQPDDDPAGEGWAVVDYVHLVAPLPPPLESFGDSDTNPGVKTIIGMPPVRRSAR